MKTLHTKIRTKTARKAKRKRSPITTKARSAKKPVLRKAGGAAPPIKKTVTEPETPVEVYEVIETEVYEEPIAVVSDEEEFGT